MNRYLDRNNSFFMTLERMANFCILNALTIIMCLPVITAGAAITAGNRVMQNMLTDGELHIVKGFFQAFAGSFRQSTVLGLIALFVLAFLGFDFIIVYLNFQQGANIFMYVVLGIITFIAVGTAAYAFAMIGRYENTLRGHLDNALYLVFRQLPRTIAIVVIWLSPVLIAIISLEWFLSYPSLGLWAFVGVSSILYLVTLLMMPVFRKLEETEEVEEGEAQ